MKNSIKILLATVLIFSIGSCKKFLDLQPKSTVTPEAFFNTQADLAAYSVNLYGNFSVPGDWNAYPIKNDVHTDVMVDGNPSYSRFVKDDWKVPTSGGGWSFGDIRNVNFFFDNVLPKYEAKQITGNQAMIRYHIGEMYFWRAWIYFNKLTTFGDFPILTKVYPNDKEELIEASKRQPRNMVARFILSDLDKAVEFMGETKYNGHKTMLDKYVALQFKSRVALYEASFEKYHSGTPRVPDGADWPGKKMDYNKNFNYNNSTEVNFFLDEAMAAAKQVADKYPLTPNSGVMMPQPNQWEGWNDYFDQFSAENLTRYPEVLIWKAYNKDQGIKQNLVEYLGSNGPNNFGLTKNFIDGYVMKNGLPIYAPGSGYNDDMDKLLSTQKTDRDDRFRLFVKDELSNRERGLTWGPPQLLEVEEHRSVTGFDIIKGLSFNPLFYTPAYKGIEKTNGFLVMRSAEAYLNYIEAYYMKNNSIGGDADVYWRAIRTRAGINPDYNITVSAIDMSKEGDWGKYSGPGFVDKTLFAIRKERSNELVGESFRWNDLVRWRAMDNINGYIPKGFNLWSEMYKDPYYAKLIEPETDKDKANVSSRNDPHAQGKYVLPYRRTMTANNLIKDGYYFAKANYLSPVPYQQFQLTQKGDDISSSVIYQNPYWPVKASGSAEM